MVSFQKAHMASALTSSPMVAAAFAALFFFFSSFRASLSSFDRFAFFVALSPCPPT